MAEIDGSGKRCPSGGKWKFVFKKPFFFILAHFHFTEVKRGCLVSISGLISEGGNWWKWRGMYMFVCRGFTVVESPCFMYWMWNNTSSFPQLSDLHPFVPLSFVTYPGVWHGDDDDGGVAPGAKFLWVQNFVPLIRQHPASVKNTGWNQGDTHKSPAFRGGAPARAPAPHLHSWPWLEWLSCGSEPRRQRLLPGSGSGREHLACCLGQGYFVLGVTTSPGAPVSFLAWEVNESIWHAHCYRLEDFIWATAASPGTYLVHMLLWWSWLSYSSHGNEPRLPNSGSKRGHLAPDGHTAAARKISCKLRKWEPRSSQLRKFTGAPGTHAAVARAILRSPGLWQWDLTHDVMMQGIMPSQRGGMHNKCLSPSAGKAHYTPVPTPRTHVFHWLDPTLCFLKQY